MQGYICFRSLQRSTRLSYIFDSSSRNYRVDHQLSQIPFLKQGNDFFLILLFSFCRLAGYLKVLMLECLHFSHTTGFLYYGGSMTLQLECC